MTYGLENPAVGAANEEVEVMRSQMRKAKFAWIPVVKTSAVLSPGANIVCDDVPVTCADPQNPACSGAGSFDFQYCRSGVSDDIDVQTIDGYFQQLGRAGVALQLDAEFVAPITTFGKILNAKRLGDVGVAAAKLKVQQTRHETILKIYEAQAALLLARESLRILDEAWAVVQEQRTKMEEELGMSGDDFGLDPDRVNPDRDPEDLLELEVVEIDLATLARDARNIEAKALGALWHIAGEGAPRGFDIAEDRLQLDTVDGGLESLDYYRQLAVKHRPEAKLAAALVKARGIQEKLARSNFFPDLGIVAKARLGYANGYDQSVDQLYYTGRLNYSTFYVGLALRWNLDFHNDVFDLQRARAQRRQAEHQRELARRFLAAEVEHAYRDLRDAKDKVDFFSLATDKNWQRVVSQRQRQSVGGGKFDDLRKALKAWAESTFRQFEAIQNHNVQLAKLSRAVGVPLAARSSRVNTSQTQGVPASVVPAQE